MAVNFASKYSDKVDERFTIQSQASLAVSNNYDFTGVKTVNVYSIPVVALNDYSRTGSNDRYGTLNDLTTSVQAMTITKDRSWNIAIDKGDRLQTQMVLEAGKALRREIDEVVVPEFDTYVFRKLASTAVANGNYAISAVDNTNAYAALLAGMEKLSNAGVPDSGRVAFCSYAFANLMLRDTAFIKYSDRSQEMTIKGIIGEADGVKIVRVPSSRLPAGCAFLLTHPMAACAPKQLDEYKIHADPPGISGWKIEGRMIYDCFVLDNKVNCIYYHGAQAVLQNINVTTYGSAANKTKVVIDPAQHNDSGLAASTGVKWYAMTATSQAGLTGVTFNTAITTANWTEVTGSGAELTVTSGHKYIRVVEVDASNKPIAVGDAKINVG